MARSRLASLAVVLTTLFAVYLTLSSSSSSFSVLQLVVAADGNITTVHTARVPKDSISSAAASSSPTLSCDAIGNNSDSTTPEAKSRIAATSTTTTTTTTSDMTITSTIDLSLDYDNIIFNTANTIIIVFKY
jgi:hypothetical protein